MRLRIFFHDTTASGTPEEICNHLNATAFLPEADARAYRHAVARRVYILKGETIRADDALGFLEDLARLGLADLERTSPA